MYLNSLCVGEEKEMVVREMAFEKGTEFYVVYGKTVVDFEQMLFIFIKIYS